jgi:hypothetical protein
MLRLTSVICICLVTLSALGEPASKYEVGTITDVKIHQATGSSTGISQLRSFRQSQEHYLRWLIHAATGYGYSEICCWT